MSSPALQNADNENILDDKCPAINTPGELASSEMVENPKCGNETVLTRVASSFEEVKCVIPDTYEDFLEQQNVSIGKTSPVCSKEPTCCTTDDAKIVEASNESSDSCRATVEAKSIEKDDVMLSDSLLACLGEEFDEPPSGEHRTNIFPSPQMDAAVPMHTPECKNDVKSSDDMKIEAKSELYIEFNDCMRKVDETQEAFCEKQVGFANPINNAIDLQLGADGEENYVKWQSFDNEIAAEKVIMHITSNLPINDLLNGHEKTVILAAGDGNMDADEPSNTMQIPEVSEPMLLPLPKFEDPSVNHLGAQNCSKMEQYLLNDPETLQVPNTNPVENSELNGHDQELLEQNGCQLKLEDQLACPVKLVGRFVHGDPILSVVLHSMGNSILVGVLCGYPDKGVKKLYSYAHDPQQMRPAFTGYASIEFALEEASMRGNFPFGRYGLQFTSDGKFLVLLNNRKVPSCSERSLTCICSSCESDPSKDNIIRIVQLNLGYVTTITKLVAHTKVLCLLVCVSDYILCAEEGGELHVWSMGSDWSLAVEEFMIPRSNCMAPSMVELREMPKFSNLVVGHNSMGSFSLWDISKRILVSNFSAPGNLTFQILPVRSCHLMEIRKNALQTEADGIFSLPFEHTAIIILLSSASISEFQQDLRANETNTRWRLAMLSNGSVVIGNVLFPRDTVVDTAGDYAYAGMPDGSFCKWHLSTGEVVFNTHVSIGGSKISCITVDGKSDAVAAGHDNGDLLLYIT